MFVRLCVGAFTVCMKWNHACIFAIASTLSPSLPLCPRWAEFCSIQNWARHWATSLPHGHIGAVHKTTMDKSVWTSEYAENDGWMSSNDRWFRNRMAKRFYSKACTAIREEETACCCCCCAHSHAQIVSAIWRTVVLQFSNFFPFQSFLARKIYYFLHIPSIYANEWIIKTGSISGSIERHT